MGSRGIYHEGWMASTFGPKKPWVADAIDLSKWDPMEDQWELFDTRKDFSLMHDLAAEKPEKLEELKALFMEVAEENKALPIGGGLFTPFNPQEQKRSTNTEWTLFDGMTRIPESQAPNVRNGNLRVEIEAEVPENVNGVIFAMGGYAGGVSLYAVDGELRLRIQRAAAQALQDQGRQASRRQSEDRVSRCGRRWNGPRRPN